MGKIISVANQKGGVGKTTTSINLSSCLARSGEKVLLVDMDPQSNTTSGIGQVKDDVAKSVYDGLINGTACRDLILDTRYDNLSLLPAHYDLTGAEIELTHIEEQREYRLKNLLDQVRDDFSFIIVDCPPSLGLLTLNAFTASDSVLIPLQAEYFALEGISQLLHTLELVRDGLNNQLEIEGILITMCDIRTNLARDVINDVTEHFPDKIYKTIIPRNIRIAESPGHGEPIVYYDMRSVGSEKYLEFTGELLESNR